MLPLEDRELGELDVQEALVAALAAASVRDQLLLRLGHVALTTAAGGVFVRAVRSVFEQDGETDILAEWESPSAGRLRVLFEVKLAAQFMPQQGTRYAARAARAVETKAASQVTTVLLAPAGYMRSANVEVHQFNATVALEDMLGLARAAGLPESACIAEALQRIAEGRPLGAKGLFRGVHDALAAEFSRRGLPLQVTNNATDWVFVHHPALGKGARLRYRIRAGIAELRLHRSYPFADELAHLQVPVHVTRLTAGSETLFRHSTLQVTQAARSGAPSDADVDTITSALLHLADWWATSAPAA